ncbi:MAG: alpha/beta fold hydrolase [Alphaproteobacteria bacterium]|nr:alpha/beta fold hydrolase [Alphaproteobacteria bacterium]
MRAKFPDQEGQIDRDGVKLHYEVYGNGPETIVFVPTWALVHSRVYKAQVPHFSDRYRVIVYDPRGNGKSDRPKTVDGYTLDAILGDLDAILSATQTDRAVLVGYSFSSFVSFVYAAENPERVSAIVSIGAWAPFVHGFDRTGTEETDENGRPMGWAKDSPDYWRRDYQDFARFFLNEINNEPHSTKQFEDSLEWSASGDGDMLAMTMEARSERIVTEETYRSVRCPILLVHSETDVICPIEGSRKIAELTGGQLVPFARGGHAPHGRFPARFNMVMRDFLEKHLTTNRPNPHTRPAREKRALYLSSPIGLGHARRDLAVTKELRKLHPGLQVNWLAQDPVTRFLTANGERIHPASRRLANESAHIEAVCGDHDLHAFQAIRSMDEILIRNFMVFQELLEEEAYDLVIADEAWDVDHYWHEHPDLKKAPVAWFTDFVGWVPFQENGPYEAYLTSDYNAEMIEHVENHPDVRDRAIFVGTADDIIDESFGAGLPDMRSWVPRHFEFSDYILGVHPSSFGTRDDLRSEFGYDDGRSTCIVSVGGSGVGATLIRRILSAYPAAKAKIPDLRMIVVTGPRIDPAMFQVPEGVEMRSFVPDLDRHLAACDLALVQGGLTTCMELTAAGTPFLYFPLRNHFEQNFHVASRLDRYNAGRRMVFSECDPDRIADAMLAELKTPRASLPVAADGAARAARMLSDLL